MNQDFSPIHLAAKESGLHINTLRRLLRCGAVRGYKGLYDGRQRWMVSTRSLSAYADPETGLLLDLPGPKTFLRRQPDIVGLTGEMAYNVR